MIRAAIVFLQPKGGVRFPTLDEGDKCQLENKSKPNCFTTITINSNIMVAQRGKIIIPNHSEYLCGLSKLSEQLSCWKALGVSGILAPPLTPNPHSRALKWTGIYSNDCSTFCSAVGEVASVLQHCGVWADVLAVLYLKSALWFCEVL